MRKYVRNVPPPYWGLRDYGIDGQLGLEKTPEEYVAKMVDIFREARRALRDDGTLWLNLGDSYASNTKGSGGPSDKQLSNAGSHYKMSQRLEHGLKPKDLVGIPWRVAFALQADGWYLRSDIIWAKPNPMPESVRDRPTRSHEYIFLLSKSKKYYYDAGAIGEPISESTKTRVMLAESRGDVAAKSKEDLTKPKYKRCDMARVSIDRYDDPRDHLVCKPVGSCRNRRSVWTITTKPYTEAHFATFPPDLIRPCILAGCPVGGVVLDPFMGAGTTALVSEKLGRNWVGIELNPKYIELAKKRLVGVQKEIT